MRTTIYVDNLDRCQVRQVATSTSPPNHRLPKRCRRRLSCVGALAGLRGYTAALIRTKCPCRKHSVVGQAAIVWMMCQQCRELMAPMGWEWDRSTCCLQPAWGLTEKFELLFALVASHAARFLTNDVFSQKDKGKGWKGESGEAQVMKRWHNAKVSPQKCWFCQNKNRKLQDQLLVLLCHFHNLKCRSLNLPL